MRLLQLKPSRAVGDAMDFLLELRLERGPLGAGLAEIELLKWWATRKQN